jgi:Pilus formation protein N terminal region
MREFTMTISPFRLFAQASSVAVCILSAASTVQANESISLMLDRATIIRPPAKTSMVVIGNPSIADVSVQKNGVMVLTGKSYGETNMIALDDQGQLISESWIKVLAPARNNLIVVRGAETETYSCTPNCQPTVVLGDSDKHFSKTGAQVGSRNSTASAAPAQAGQR